MKQQPDKLFQEKLSGSERPAPSMAWDKIESQLDKKNNKGWWLRVAAAVLLLAIAIPTTYLVLHKNDSIQIASTDVHVKNSKVDAVVESTTNSKSDILKEPQLKESAVDVESSHQSKKAKKSEGEKKSQGVAVIDNSIPPTVVSEIQEEKNVTQNPDEIIQPVILESIQPELAQADAADTKKNVTLVFSTQETTSYFEGGEKVSEDEATSKDNKSSTFKKLLRKASGLKTNQDPFGELRQKKNEILALNFKSDKKRGQKNN